MTWYRIRVDLRDASPKIWRELLVPSDTSLPDLHLALQAAMGWQNAHLHAFARGPQPHWHASPRWVMAIDEGLDDDESTLPEAEATLATLLPQPGDHATYLYDFGDDWEHLLTLVETLDGDPSAVGDLASPVLTDGAGVCPPEDCGGVGGHDELLDAVEALVRGDRLEEWPEHTVRWAFGTLDPEQIRAALTFDLPRQQSAFEAACRPLPPLHPALAELVAAFSGTGPDSPRGMVQAADLQHAAPVTTDDAVQLTENLRWFLDVVGEDGLALTAAGYLRPAVVQQVAARLHLEREWIGSLNREDLTPGVADFRALVVGLGLVRKAKGRLAATKVGAALRSDPVRLLQHIADRMPLGREEFERQASMLVVLDLLTAPESRSASMSRCAAILGARGWRAGSREVGEWDVYHGVPQMLALLKRSGLLLDDDRGHRWALTPAGAAFLRRVLRGEPVSA